MMELLVRAKTKVGWNVKLREGLRIVGDVSVEME